MRFKTITNHLIPLSLAAGFVACSSAKPTPDAAPTAKAEEKPAPVAETPKATTPDANAEGQAELERAMEQLRNVSVFFEFDSATLSQEAKDKLSTVGTILAKHPDLKVRIEGNCDERGSEQYNLALGQRRADSAKRYLVSMGAHERQLTAISFGDQKPKATGHDEDAWRQNRRDDLAAIPASYQSK
ncbi:MAG TPA: peptidoglycan-associated lipoprotein Pal [Myxococcales bacterium]|nr:peptidoglycan-associated lipoprotein Pal [Myxococcales bacterium]